MTAEKKRNDRKLIAALCILAVLLLLASSIVRRQAAERAAVSGRIASVSLDGTEVLRLLLPEDGSLEGDAAGNEAAASEKETSKRKVPDDENAGSGAVRVLYRDEAYAVLEGDGYRIYAGGAAEPSAGSNLLTVKNGRIACTEADCPDQVCVRTGYIAYETETIVCLPHRMIVSIGTADGTEGN